MDIDNLLLAAKKITYDGEDAIYAACKLVGQQNAASMLIAHLQLTLNPNQSFPLDPAINERIKEILKEKGMLEISLYRGEFRFLSNFWLVDIVYGGRMWPSVEHAFQAYMTNDEAMRQKIHSMINPSDVKKESQKEDFPLRNDKEEIQLFLMSELIKRKFSVKDHPELAYKLFLTDPLLLIEGNNWGDTYWGICGNIGYNNLGKLQMQQRENIKVFIEEVMQCHKRYDPKAKIHTAEGTLISGVHLYKWQQMLGLVG